MNEQQDRFWRGLLAGLVVSSSLAGALLAAWQRFRARPAPPAPPLAPAPPEPPPDRR